MVGLWFLVPAIGVRVPDRQHESLSACGAFSRAADQAQLFGEKRCADSKPLRDRL